MIGTLANAQDKGSKAIFSTREAAEEFANGDPFVLNGVVRHWYIREGMKPSPIPDAVSSRLIWARRNPY